ncbi:unnamed protein product, partial [Allacma fusca]
SSLPGPGNMSSIEDAAIPSWFCPFKIPPSLSGSFHPIVYLVGLDISAHRNVWESLNLQNVNKTTKLVYKIVPIGYKFPTKKVKNDPVECYLPHGLVKSNWVSKHLNDIPAVCIIFFDLNWTSAEWNERKQKCAQLIKQLKAEANPHGTQVLVMLIKNDIRDDLTNEKASALCAEAEILPKHLFVLPQGRLDKIQACLQRLEYETDLYYKTRVKKIIQMKEKATHTPLIVRHNFKIAFFQEVRADFEAALSQYQGAYDALLNIKMTEANVQELKVVASLLNYRICRLTLLTPNLSAVPPNLKDCKAQFDKHIRSYYKVEGNAELIFEHWAWLEQQYHLYGELLKFNYRIGGNFPDPVSYFLVASRYAEKRKNFYLAKIKPKNITAWSPDMIAYKRELELPFLGQRPWRMNSFSLENAYTVEDQRAVATLTYLESKTNHSDAIIKHLGVASEFCKDTKRKRTRCQLMCSMGIEFYSASDYRNCILLMRHVLREWSYKKWNKIIVKVAEIGLRASCCEGDVPNYLNFLIILLTVDASDNEMLVTNLLAKFQAVMEGKMPLVEEGCEINIGNWNDSLNQPFVSSVEVHDNCILNFNVYFVKDSVVHIQPAVIRFELINQSYFPISVKKYGILRTNIPDYVNIEASCDIILQPGDKKELDLELKVFSRDIGKILQIQVAYVDIGKENRSVILHNSLVPCGSSTWIDDARKEKLKLMQTSCRIEAPKLSLEVKMKREGSLLVNEWYKINVSWFNKDESDFSRLMCTYMLSASDTHRAVLTPDPEKKSSLGSCIYTTKVDKLVAEGTLENIFYIKTSNPSETELRLVIEGKYFDSHHQPLIVKYEESVDVLGPFDVTQTISNLQANKIDHVSVGDEFCISFAVQNISKTTLRIFSCSLNIKSPLYTIKDTVEKQVNDIVLKDGEKLECLFFLTASGNDSTSFGHLEIVWNRDELTGGFTTKTEIPVIPLAKRFSPLCLQASFSNNGRGKLKTPMLACYTILNRSLYVHDITVSMDSNESFMNGGPKKVTMKLKSKEEMDFSYILFPLVTGCVPVPKLVIESSRSEGGEVTAIDTVDVPKSIFVTP